MKLAPIINQLANELPLYTDKFSNTVDITTLTTASTLATVVTATSHNFLSGQYIIISGAVDITSVTSLDLVDGVVTGRTATDHGLNMAMNFKTLEPNPQVVIQGANESEFNGTFDLASVPNRTSFTFNLDEPDATASGTIQALKYDSSRFFGAKEITVVDTETFTFAVTAGFDGLIGGDKVAHSQIRVSGAATLERADESYTKFGENQYCMFVIGGTSTSSKDRNVLNDAVAAQSQNSEYRIRLIDDFDVVVFVPTDGEISGRLAFDNLEDTKINIFQSILGLTAPQQYNSDEQFQLTFVGSEIASYNTAYIVGQYKFQTLYDITYFDTIRLRNFFPARDINYDMGIIVNESNGDDLIFSIDLDDDPDF